MAGRGQGSAGTASNASSQSGSSSRGRSARTPDIQLIRFDGRSIWVQWLGGNPATPFVVALLGADIEILGTEVSYGAQWSGPFSATLDAPIWFDPQVTYSVAVAEARGTNTVKSSTALIVAPPVVEAVDFDGTAVVASCRSGGRRGASLVLTHLVDGHELARAAANRGTEVRYEPERPVAAALRHEIRVHYKNATCVGPASPAIPLVLDAPIIVSSAAGIGRVDVHWTTAPTSPSTGGVIALSDGATVNRSVVNGHHGSVSSSGLNDSGPRTITVRGVVGRSIGPPSDAATALSTVPQVESVVGRRHLTGADVAVAEVDEPGVNALRIELRSGGVVVGEAVTPLGGGVVAAPLDPAREYRVAAQVLGPSGSGPIGPSAGVMVAVPPIESIGTSVDASETAITVTVTDPTHRPFEVGVRAALLADATIAMEAESTGSSVRLTLVEPPASGVAYTVNVQGFGHDGADLSSPASDAVPVVVHAPRVIAVDWDGEAVAVSWEPLVQAGLVGYTATLHSSDGSSSTHVTTDVAHARLPLNAPAPGTGYSVTVVGRTAVSVGPPSAPLEVQTDPRPGAWFVADAVVDAPRTVYRADPRRAPAPPAGRLSYFLPELFTADPVVLPQVTGLKLEPTGDPDLPWELTVGTSNNAWQLGGDPVRPQARSDVADFFATFEDAVDGSGAPVLRPGALRLIGEVLARGVPMTFAETLLYAYGLDPDSRSVDLSPGMRLVVRASAYQLVPPDGSVGDTLSGYVPAGTQVFDLVSGRGDGSGSGATIDVDPLLALVAPTTVDRSLSHGTQGEDTGLGGALDLLQVALRRPYLRVVYPSTVPASAAKGSIGTERQVALVGADSWSALQSAGNDVATTGSLTAGSAAVATFFRGRAALTAEIRVVLDGAETWVPVGTTVRQLLDRVTRSPLAGGSIGYGSGPRHLGMTRRADVVVTSLDRAGATSASGAEPVVLTGGQAATGSRVDRIDLPLLAGDAVVTAEGSSS